MPPLSSCRRARSFLLLLGAATPLAAQTPPRLPITREVLVPAERANLTEIGTTLLLRNGDLIMTQYREGVVRRFDRSGAPTVIGRKGEGPSEFQMPTIAGTVGDSLWIGDVRLRRTTFFRPDRTLLRTVPYPDAAKASGNGVRWQMVMPLAYLRNGVLLADGWHDPVAARPAWATPTEWSGSAILRLAASGVMQQAGPRSRRRWRGSRRCILRWRASSTAATGRCGSRWRRRASIGCGSFLMRVATCSVP
ncbi:MAG: hypothetical protein IPJ11_00910 [Gemmatimonadetes bacterium]|nr:hypothetical protein [Gemmatimonadota bacterium]